MFNRNEYTWQLGCVMSELQRIILINLIRIRRLRHIIKMSFGMTDGVRTPSIRLEDLLFASTPKPQQKYHFGRFNLRSGEARSVN